MSLRSVLDAYVLARAANVLDGQTPEPDEPLTRCPHCGTELDADLGFCPWCSAELDRLTATDQPAEQP